jgi:sulfate permease, SulP family
VNRQLAHYLPIAAWLPDYQRQNLSRDLTAAIIVAVLLIPQSLAYAMLAGVPAEIGLYASMLPLLAYAFFGTSRTLSVGPVAVISLMTATALGSVAEQGTDSYLVAAAVLALLSGLILTAMGLLKLGFITNFLSHAVISGFITASGMLIALAQLRHLLGVQGDGDTIVEILPALSASLDQLHWPTLLLGSAVILFLYLSRNYAVSLLRKLGLSCGMASLLSRTAPIFAVIFSIAAVVWWDLGESGIQLTGHVPAGLPALGIAMPSLTLMQSLLVPALLISIIGYVESISVGRTLGSKRRQKVDANQELLALGAANIASSVSGGFPVTGGFSRSVVNFDAGAVTQAASIMAAAGIALASLFLTPLLYHLPKAALAAVIVVAVMSLVDFSVLRRTWRFSRSDFYAIITTIAVTLFFGVELGVACGVLSSIALHLNLTARPHVAEVGLIEGTEHFRNVKRYNVMTVPEILTLRPDESLFFANTSYLEDVVTQALSDRPRIAHVILLCSAVNEIDFSALEMLESLNQQLAEQKIKLHLSEVKGPVMDKLKHTGFLEHISGQVFVSQYLAFRTLTHTL